MDLTIIGAGPAYSDRPGDVGACYLVTHDGTAIALDLGHGTFAGLASRLAPERLTAVFVSHLHADHFIDLVPLRHYLRYEMVPCGRGRVLAPAALTERLDGLHGEVGWSAAALDVETLGEGELRVGSLLVEARRVTHTDDSFAFRVSAADGPGLVYSGDIGVADDLRSLVRRGDTLLVEASFGPGPGDPGANHLDGSAVGALAADARPGRVLLTHILMGRDREATVAAVARTYDGPVSIVESGLEVRI